MPVLLIKQRVSVSEPPFVGGLGVTYAIHLEGVGHFDGWTDRQIDGQTDRIIILKTALA